MGMGRSDWCCRHWLAAVTILTGCLAGRSDAADVQRAAQVSRGARRVSDALAGEKRGANSPRYTFRKIHDPNGTGKFYMGREIAKVMGFRGATWLERPEREREEKLSMLLDALKLKPGTVVADIGAGSGVLTVLMAKKVDPGGKVVAVDVQQEMLHLLRKKLKQRQITNVELVRGTAKSPRLPAASVDLAVLVDVYHEFSFPYEMLLELSKALKPGGRIMFVEYRREDPKVRRLIKLVHTMTQAQVKKEIGQPQFGLKWKATIDVLPRQHIVVFERTGGSLRDSGRLRPSDVNSRQSPFGSERGQKDRRHRSEGGER